MPRLRHLIGITVLGLAVAGCVPAEQYAALKMRSEQLAEQLAQAQTATDQARAEAAAAKQQAAMSGNSGQTQSALIANMQNQLAESQKDSDTWRQKYEDAIGKLATAGTGSGPALPQQLDTQLSAFASQNPDLIEYDSARGIVKFKSDVTFAVGDATVTAKAHEVLTRFASILNSGGANSYELMIAGHTDNTPVTNPRTIKLGHFDNWYLSAHRAIAVARELATEGVSSTRMGVVGYADKHPIAANTSEAGKLANRRVEVLILPASARSAPGVAVASEPSARPAAHKITHTPVAPPNKDQASVNFNK